MTFLQRLSPEQRSQLPSAVKIERSRRHFYQFQKNTSPSEYNWNWHHGLIGEWLNDFVIGKRTRIIIEAPPRHGKSEGTSRRLPAYIFGKVPSARLIACSHTADLAEEMGRDVRAIMDDHRYKQVFPGAGISRSRKGRDRGDLFDVEGGGVYKAAGVGGPITGRGYLFGIIDDYLKNREDANSPAIREKQWRWYTSTFRRRQEKNARILITACMVGDTSVTMSDGTHRPLKDIRIGDQIATYDDGVIVASTVKNWKNQGTDPIFEIRMKSGIIVKANERHPFLVDTSGGMEWVRVRNLRVRDKIVSVNSHSPTATIGGSGAESSVPTTNAPSQQIAKDIARLIIKNTNGPSVIGHHQSIRNRAEISNCDTDMESSLPNTTRSLLHKKGSAPSVNCRLEKTSERIGAASCASITTTRQAKSEGCSATIATFSSGMEKQNKCYSERPIIFEIGTDIIEEISEAGQEDVFDIHVERTENFIANGLVSHNTRWHDDDLIGRIKKKIAVGESEPFDILTLPGVMMDLEKKNIDDPRELNQALWPWFYTEAQHEQDRLIEPRDFAALTQQDPRSEGGSEWPSSYFETPDFWYNVPPVGAALKCIYYDGAGSPGAKIGDWHSATLLTITADGHLYADQRLWRAPQEQAADILLTLLLEFEPDGAAVESNFGGTILAPLIGYAAAKMGRPDLVGKFVCRPSTLKKEARIRRLGSYFSQGLLHIRENAGGRETMRQAADFPNGDFDDGLDSLDGSIQFAAELLA